MAITCFVSVNVPWSLAECNYTLKMKFILIFIVVWEKFTLIIFHLFFCLYLMHLLNGSMEFGTNL